MNDPIYNYAGRNGVIAANALLEGGAIGYLLGPAAGACATITSVALTCLSDRPLYESSHIPLNLTGLAGVIDTWCDGLEGMLLTNTAFGLIALAMDFTFEGPIIRVLRHSFATRTAVLSTCFRVCVIAPIVEGLAFRGFLQDRLHDIQCIFFRADTAASKKQQIVRVEIQALFCTCYFACDEMRIIELIPKYLNASKSGSTKEKSQHLTGSMSQSSLFNTVVALRVAVFGT